MSFFIVVDDNEIDRKICERAARRSQVVDDLLVFAHPEDAITYCSDAANPAPDVLLLDLSMPRIDGFEFLARAAAEFPDFLAIGSVVILTSSVNPEDKARAFESRFVSEYLYKPIRAGDLAALSALRRSH